MICCRRIQTRRAFYTVALMAVIVVVVMAATLQNGSYRRTLSRYLLNYGASSQQQRTGPRVYRYGGSTDTLVVWEGQHSLYSDRVDSMSDASVKILHQSGAPLEITADCTHAAALGKLERNHSMSWNLCISGPYSPRTPCFAFSFGRNQNNWQLELNLASHFKCQVFSLDPLTRQIDSGQNVLYLREGLYNRDDNGPGFTDNFLGHLKRFRADSLLIDVLKLDIGEGGWQAIHTAVKDGSLKLVKQILFSVPVHQKLSMEQMRDQIRSLASLHQIGFRLWLHNMVTMATNSSELRLHFHFINVNFALESQTSRNPVDSDQLHNSISHLPIVKLPGFDKLRDIRSKNVKSFSRRQLEDLYYQLVEQLHLHCPYRRRIGGAHDGGWDVCFSGPFDIRKSRPCVVFSFGINNVFGYDDQLADEFHCKVYMFDPSMSTGDHQRRNTSWFYRTGLSSDNTVARNGWKMRTLCTLFKELGYADKQIDILKIDVEFWEWSSLEKALEEGCLNRVRQLMFETHTGALLYKQSDYARFIKILLGIFDLGFASWNSCINNWSHIYNFTGVPRPCCYENYLINKNLLHV